MNRYAMLLALVSLVSSNAEGMNWPFSGKSTLKTNVPTALIGVYAGNYETQITTCCDYLLKAGFQVIATTAAYGFLAKTIPNDRLFPITVLTGDDPNTDSEQELAHVKLTQSISARDASQIRQLERDNIPRIRVLVLLLTPWIERRNAGQENPFECEQSSTPILREQSTALARAAITNSQNVAVVCDPEQYFVGSLGKELLTRKTAEFRRELAKQVQSRIAAREKSARESTSHTHCCELLWPVSTQDDSADNP